jgi:hypothetical protein
MYLKDTYRNAAVIYSWVGLKEEFPHISNVAVKKLPLFIST